MNRFTNRTVIITGGASGIGQAAARRIFAEGANVVVVDVNGDGARHVAESLDDAERAYSVALDVTAGAAVIIADRDEVTTGKAAEGLGAAGRNAIGIACDVTDRGQVKAMVEQAVGTYGRLDAAFNNAGINCDGAPLIETEDDEFDAIVNVNLRGVWNCMKAELRQMVAQGSGAIVNCSSIGGMRGSKGRAAYSASKFGVIGLTRASALDYADKGIRINAVCPGIIGNTPMAAKVTKNYDPDIIKAFVAAEPIGRLGEPEEIAAAVLWLCSPAASFVIGHAMAIDGGILA